MALHGSTLEEIAQAAEFLRRGGMVTFPAWIIYDSGADAAPTSGVSREHVGTGTQFGGFGSSCSELSDFFALQMRQQGLVSPPEALLGIWYRAAHGGGDPLQPNGA